MVVGWKDSSEVPLLCKKKRCLLFNAFESPEYPPEPQSMQEALSGDRKTAFENYKKEVHLKCSLKIAVGPLWGTRAQMQDELLLMSV